MIKRTFTLAYLLMALCLLPSFTYYSPDQPAKVVFIEGQNLMEIGTDKLRIDLSELGVDYFDNNTSDTPLFSEKDGWVHYIMNPAWHAVLVIWEKQADTPAETHARYMIIHASDESALLPKTAVQDESGVFAVATKKGIMMRPGNGIGYYLPVSSALGLEEMKDTRLSILEYDPELKQKVVEVRFSNATLTGIKIGVENRQIGYLVN